jgi:UDP-N-acetylmuramoylalanine--D-glutamate ligase
VHWNGKDVLVVGTKRSGLGAVELLQKYGARVRAMDAEPLSSDEQAKFAALSVPVVLQTIENLRLNGRDPDLIVLSPGVPFDTPPFVIARERGVPVIGEVELAGYFLKGPVIGITGSNGKTTTTALTGHVLKACGVACQVGGNIGTAITTLVDSSVEDQWNVVELSSFQLETIERFRARIGACLNVTPDHLDRHGTMDKYAAAKRRLFETQVPGDFAVLNYDDPICRSFAARTSAEVCWFSASQPVPQGMAMENGQLLYCGEAFMARDQITLRGMHNVENVMAAALVAHLAGAELDEIGAAVASFPGVEHRIEFVRKLGGVEYYNDSKATNVDAALKAIAAFPGNLWIILGGKDKGSDYRPLRQPLQERAKGALLIGAPPPYPHAAAPLIKEALLGAIPLIDCGTLGQAVHYVREHAAAGDVVLLAPACASFDQFQNYEERGKMFKQTVAELF